MAEALTALLLEGSKFSIDPPGGRLLYRISEEETLKEEELIPSSEVDELIPYPLLNPLQSLFYRLYKGGSALVASPTSSGKSLIAYLFMRNFKGRLVYTAPTKALVKEKAVELRKYYGKSVEMRTGESVLESYKEVRAKVVVSTYEHLAYSFRNSARWLKDVSAVVIDEVHQILKRWVLEEVITSCLKAGLPMLSLSATLPGVEELAGWTGSQLVIKSLWRPVPLIRESYSLSQFEPIVEELEGEELTAGRLLQALFTLSKQGESVILFVPKKSLGWKLLELASIERIGIMNQTVPFEVSETREPEIAFHNADVPKEEREAIEKAFREGNLRFLIATQTLAYGVNLPADRVLVLVRFFRKGSKFVSIPDALDILQMEGRAGRLGIREVGYSNLLVQGASKSLLEKELKDALEKPFSTAVIEEGLNIDAVSFFLLLAHMHEGSNYKEYLKHTYSFRRLEGRKVERVEEFLRERGYIRKGFPTDKGLFCIKTGIPPTRFEEFLRRRELSLEPVITLRPLLHMKRFDGLFQFIRRQEGFRKAYELVKARLSMCGQACFEDNTDQFLFYVMGLTIRYPNLKSPPGEFSYLGTDALHLIRTLLEVERQGFYSLGKDKVLSIAHAVKYGIEPDYAGLSGIKGIGHIRANLLKEVFEGEGIKVPALGEPVEELILLMESHQLWENLLEKLVSVRKMPVEKAREELGRVRRIMKNNAGGYLVDDHLLLALGLFTLGEKAIRLKKRELLEELLWSYQSL